MVKLNGDRLYCRVAEEKIVEVFIAKKSKKISIRDSVIVNDEKTIYRLWNTNLVEKIGDDIYINISSNMDEINRMYPNGFYPRRDYIISNTTKSRLNVFLDYYGFNSLEVHSSKKDWSVKHNGKKLKIDSWYKLNFSNKELIECKK